MLGWLSFPRCHPMTSISHAHDGSLDPISQKDLPSRNFFFRDRFTFCLFQLSLTALLICIPIVHSAHAPTYSLSTSSTQTLNNSLVTSVRRSSTTSMTSQVKIRSKSKEEEEEEEEENHLLQSSNESVSSDPFHHNDDRFNRGKRKGNFPYFDSSSLPLSLKPKVEAVIPNTKWVKERLKNTSTFPEDPAIWSNSSMEEKITPLSVLRETLNNSGIWKNKDEKIRNINHWKSVGSAFSQVLDREKQKKPYLMDLYSVLKTRDVPFSFSAPSSYQQDGVRNAGSDGRTITRVINSSSPHLHRSPWTAAGSSHYGGANEADSIGIGEIRSRLTSPDFLQMDNFPLGNFETKRRIPGARRENAGKNFANYIANKMDIIPSRSGTKISPRFRTYRQINDGEIFVKKMSQENYSGRKNVSIIKTYEEKVSTVEETQVNQSTTHRNKRRVDTSEVSVMEGGVAELPCDLKVGNPNDSVQLILWIKEGIHTPLYSYDYRELQGGRPKEMKPDVNSTLAQRTSFRTDSSPAALLIERVEAEDAGIYRCRADFSLSPTINRRVNLTVIVPPRIVKVSWLLEGSNESKDVVDQVAGPFLENARPTLICSNEDGWPPASISWYEDDLLLDDSHSIHLTKGVVENQMTLQPLTRGDLGRRFTCLAYNNNRTKPASTTVTIGLTLGILGLRMDEIGRVWAGEKTEVECAVWGSRPLPTVVWWLGPHMKTPSKTKVMDEGNLTISVLSFIPRPEDDGVMLICQATNDGLPEQAVQDSRLLSVNYSPVVTIHLGTSLDPSVIKEGDDVYFECSVKAKPPVFKVVWKHNGEELSTGLGVFVANMSLVLQRVNRSHAGEYSCEATNIRDTVTSAPISLDIKYTPVCIQPEKAYFSVARGESTVVSCRVESNPPNVTFSWSFNNSAEAVHIPSDKFVVVGTESRVSYRPEDEMDYGSLQCKANNTIGMQATPCLFKIIPAGKPDPPHHCRVSDVTISSLQVHCLPGDDGGLNQTFLLQKQVFKIGEKKRPVAEVEGANPTFSVSNLRPATPYRIVVVAINNMGPSRVSELKTYTARIPESHQETSAEPTRDRERESVVPFIIMVGGGVVLVPLVVVVVLIVRVRFCRNSSPRKGNSQRGTSSHAMDPPSTDIASNASSAVDECNPDILSHTSGVTCEQPQWKNKGTGDISTLSATLHNPPHVPTAVASIHAQNKPDVHLSMQPNVVSASQVPYYTDARFGQPMGKVAVLSSSPFTQVRQDTVSQETAIPGFQQPSEEKVPSEHYLPFPHICYPSKGRSLPNPCGSKHDVSQLQENLVHQTPNKLCHSSDMHDVQKEFFHREESKEKGNRICQFQSFVPAPRQVTVPSLVGGSKVLYSSTSNSPSRSVGENTLKRQKARIASGDTDLRTSVQGDGVEPKVESCL